ncbi:hypothetical protein GYA19_03795 [Candidatus Beckwithbacteria bacterium]|nr:hypothetical protein [Candidatus Beckwithbacteria bacterium]
MLIYQEGLDETQKKTIEEALKKEQFSELDLLKYLRNFFLRNYGYELTVDANTCISTRQFLLSLKENIDSLTFKNNGKGLISIRREDIGLTVATESRMEGEKIDLSSAYFTTFIFESNEKSNLVVQFVEQDPIGEDPKKEYTAFLSAIGYIDSSDSIKLIKPQEAIFGLLERLKIERML